VVLSSGIPPGGHSQGAIVAKPVPVIDFGPFRVNARLVLALKTLLCGDNDKARAQGKVPWTEAAIELTAPDYFPPTGARGSRQGTRLLTEPYVRILRDCLTGAEREAVDKCLANYKALAASIPADARKVQKERTAKQETRSLTVEEKRQADIERALALRAKLARGIGATPAPSKDDVDARIADAVRKALSDLTS